MYTYFWAPRVDAAERQLPVLAVAAAQEEGEGLSVMLVYNSCLFCLFCRLS